MRRLATPSIPLDDDVSVFCDFAERSGRTAFANAIRLVYDSCLNRTALQQDHQIGEFKSTNESALSEVDYKQYPRFETIPLPKSGDEDELSLSVARLGRRSCRQFSDRSLPITLIATALHFAYADRHGLGYPSRAFPSAGGLYCTETYVVTGRVSGLSAGAYHYAPHSQCLHVLPNRTAAWDKIHAALGQEVGSPAAFLVQSVRFGPLISKYGNRGIRFALLEVGAAAEVLDLTATALGLSTLWLGGFADEEVSDVIGVSPIHELEAPLVIIAVGYGDDRDK